VYVSSTQREVAVATTPMTVRVEESVLARAKVRAGGSAQLAEVVRRMVATYASGKWEPGEEGKAERERVKAIMRRAVDEVG
jgi:hypothetical protein